MNKTRVIALLLSLATLSTIHTAVHADHDRQTSEVRVARFQILGMVTNNCPLLVEAAVRRIPGVRAVHATLATKSAVVEYVVGTTSPQAIQLVIKDKTGFESRLLQPE